MGPAILEAIIALRPAPRARDPRCAGRATAPVTEFYSRQLIATDGIVYGQGPSMAVR